MRKLLEMLAKALICCETESCSVCANRQPDLFERPVCVINAELIWLHDFQTVLCRVIIVTRNNFGGAVGWILVWFAIKWTAVVDSGSTTAERRVSGALFVLIRGKLVGGDILGPTVIALHPTAVRVG